MRSYCTVSAVLVPRGHQAAVSININALPKASAHALSLHVHYKFYTREGDLLSRCIGQSHLWPAAAHRVPVACMEDLLVIQAAART
jgi:hypothetical protein